MPLTAAVFYDIFIFLLLSSSVANTSTFDFIRHIPELILLNHNIKNLAFITLCKIKESMNFKLKIFIVHVCAFL